MARGDMQARAVAVLGSVFAATVPGLARAQVIELRGPLVAAPAGHKLVREGRVAASVFLGTGSVGGAAVPALAGGEVLVHPFDVLGFGLWGTWDVSGARSGSNQSRDVRSVVAPQILLVPVTGRGHFGDQFWVAYDLHLALGGAWVAGGQEAPAPFVGAGLRAFWPGMHWSIGVEYRAIVDEPWQAITLSLGVWPQDTKWADD